MRKLYYIFLASLFSLLLASPDIRCAATTTWAPLTTSQENKIAGIGVDYWKIVKAKLHIQQECKVANSWSEILEGIKKNQLDITLAAPKTQNREKFAIFTKPYAKYPIVVVTRDDVGFVADIELLSNKTIALARDYASSEITKKYYSDLNFVYTDNIEDALELVREKKAFATLDILPVITYLINKNKFRKLKISGSIPYTLGVSFMLNKNQQKLRQQIDKVLDSIPVDMKNKINNKWIKVRDNNSKPYYLLAITLVLLAIAIAILVYLSKKLKEALYRAQKLGSMATHDPLTKVYNRYMFKELIEKEIAYSFRNHRVFSVSLFDINGFKQINDTYGHKVGDMILIELSELVNRHIRTSDTLFRWGGDEFVILQPDTTEEQSIKLCNKLENIIENNHFFKNINISCTFSSAQYNIGDKRDDLFNRVDKKFYENKGKPINR